MSEDLLRVFGEKSRIFAKDRGADAREFFGLQVNLWRHVLERCMMHLGAMTGQTEAIDDLQRISNIISERRDILYKISKNEPNESIVVTSLIPLLDDKINYDQIINKDIFYFVGSVSHEIIPPIARNAHNQSIKMDFLGLSSGIFIQMSARYAAERSLKNYAHLAELNSLFSKNKSLADDLGSLLNTSRARVSNLEKQHEVAVREFDTEKVTVFEEFLSDADAIQKQKSAMIQEIKAEASQMVQAHIAAQKEFDKIQRPVKLWTEASKSHRNKFALGLLLLFIIFTIGAVTISWQLQNILQNFGLSAAGNSKDFSPATTVSVAMIIAMIAAAGFIFKILGRFVTNSLTLSEDASVRAALADTFIGFTAEDTKATEADRKDARTVMLAALFRPLPGHQQEDISAPTVLSLAQDLLKQKS